MEITIIVAMSENRVIGRGNALPWSIKADLARFRDLTLGSPCIMGRRTWESLPKRPLPGRPNVVISRSMREAPGGVVFDSLDGAIRSFSGHAKIFICGGGAVYREAIAIADRIELTLVQGEIDGDVFFPEINPALWKEVGVEGFDGFSFISYSRKAE